MKDELRWSASYVVGGVTLGRVGRQGEALIAEWVGVAELRARRDGSEVRFVPSPGAAPALVEKIRRGSAALLLRHLEGHIGLHGSAIAVDGRAVAFIGPGGAGKSTLAASVCALEGGELLADDAVALERGPRGFGVVPLERQHWLDAGARRALGLPPGADGGKQPTPAAQPALLTVPLAALVEPAFGDVAAPTLTPLAGTEALAALLPQVVRFIVDEPAAARAEVDALSELASRLPIMRLTRPRDFGLLASTAKLVATLARRGPAL